MHDVAILVARIDFLDKFGQARALRQDSLGDGLRRNRRAQGGVPGRAVFSPVDGRTLEQVASILLKALLCQ
jgi:hypothetical protein